MSSEENAIGIREQLIIAGIEELSVHGIENFSLRRVATACHVSCAAPYKHFKNKDEMIGEIVAYINSQWALLRTEVANCFEGDPFRQLSEICVAFVRFWVTNPYYRKVMLSASFGRNNASEHLDRLIGDYAFLLGLSENELNIRKSVVRAALYGYVMMIESGEMKNDADAFDMIRQGIEKLLK